MRGKREVCREKISLKIVSQWTRTQRSESSVAGQELDAAERRCGKGPRRKNCDSGQSRAERKRQEEPGMRLHTAGRAQQKPGPVQRGHMG